MGQSVASSTKVHRSTESTEPTGPQVHRSTESTGPQSPQVHRSTESIGPQVHRPTESTGSRVLRSRESIESTSPQAHTLRSLHFLVHRSIGLQPHQFTLLRSTSPHSLRSSRMKVIWAQET